MKTFLCVALSCVLMSFVQADDPKTTMTVGVVEGNPVTSTSAVATKTVIQTNADTYIQDIRSLLNKQITSYDIIVFPEYGLTGRNFKEVEPISIQDNITLSDINLKYLNSLASQETILVANVLEKDNDDLFSTTVVLDGSDKLVAKYRKININETEKDNLKSADKVVTFVHPKLNNIIGLMSGDDILYENPIRKLVENATTIIYTSSMRSIGPFSVSLSLQAGFAKAHGVNLLVASLNDPDNGTSGSGIYTPCGVGASFITANKLSKAAMAQIAIKPSDCAAKSLNHDFRTILRGTDAPVKNLLIYKLNDPKTEIVNANVDKTICDGSFCCYFSIASSKWDTSEHYRLAVQGGDQKICALMICKSEKDDDLKNCGVVDNKGKTSFDKISIGTAENEKLFRPYILHSTLVPDANIGKFNFSEVSDKTTNFSATAVTDAIAVGIVSAKSGADTFGILTTNVIILSVLLKYLF